MMMFMICCAKLSSNKCHVIASVAIEIHEVPALPGAWLPEACCGASLLAAFEYHPPTPVVPIARPTVR